MAFYQAQLRSIPDLWIKVHSDLSLPPPDPIWPQTASRLMFEDMLVEMLKGKHLQARAAAPEEQVHMGADQENGQLWLTIRVHAFIKMVLEEHKHEKQVTTAKAKALRAALQLDDRSKTD